MTATTNYQAGIETTNVQVSYGQENNYGVPPSVPFQALRLTGESLAGQKTRSRPGEILTTGEVAAATTTQEMASGSINFALSYGTYDDFFSGVLRNDWSASRVVTGASGDITLSAGAVNTVRTLTATTSKFAGIPVGAWVRVLGFTANPLVNDYWQVTANTGTVLSILLPMATTSETPGGSAVVVKSSTLTNGTMFKSFTVQKQFSPNLFLQYPGVFVSGFSISGSNGNYLSGSFTLMAQQELSGTTSLSAGSVVAAPTGRVHDPVGGFQGVFLNGLPIPATVDSFQIDVSSSGAAQEFGMGSSGAAGQIMGLLEAKGTMKVYFRDFSLYSRFKSELGGVLTFITADPSGSAYAITLLNATIMNPSIVAGGPSQAVYASFNVEGNPQSGGGTVQIDRLS